MEAVRTEKAQTKYQPLKPYMSAKALGNSSLPWKQVLMFIHRTQQRHSWRSPKYQLTRRQREAWKVLLREASREHAAGASQEVEEQAEEEQEGQEEQLSDTQKACLHFCITLLDQQVQAHEYESALVCALAVLGVQRDGWKTASQYPSTLSAVIKISRFLAVQQALEQGGTGVGQGQALLLATESQGEQSKQRRQRWIVEEEEEEVVEEEEDGIERRRWSNTNPPSCVQVLKSIMDKFMIRGSHSPMQWMLDLRSYGMKIGLNTTAAGHIQWEGDQLLYKAFQFRLVDFRSMIHGLVGESKRLLVEDLLFCASASGLPQVPWALLRDNPAEAKPGWNFLQDPRCQWPVKGESWLFQRVGSMPELQDKFVSARTASGVNAPGVKRYLAQVVEFQEKMLVLMHLTGGQPARAPEILSIRHSNTAKGEHRNVFVEEGLLVFVTRYHKGYAISGDVKIIHRYLPKEVGQLVVWYLWLVLPFYQQMEALLTKPAAVSFHLWPSGPDRKKWTSERMRKVIKRESMIGLGQQLTIQSYRDIAIGISRRYITGNQAFRMDEEDEDGEWDEDADAAALDQQATHSPHTAGTVYARGIMEGSGVVASMRQRFRKASMAWHKLLGFGSVPSEQGLTRKREPFEAEADEGRMLRWKRLRTADPRDTLRELYGPQATFRGVQQPAIQAILAGESPVVAVMPTGGGKSLLFMLAAFLGQRHSGTTIVVVPLVPLREDLKQRCEAKGLHCVEWNSRLPADGAAIVLVTPESAVGDTFLTFLNRLRAMRQLDRIVIDECHVILNKQYSFRKQLQQLPQLAIAETQFVLLTATLPPHQEGELWERMSWPAESVRMFRDVTVRKNIRYSVVYTDQINQTGTARRSQQQQQGKEGSVLLWLQERQRQLSQTGGKMVVYAKSVSRVQKLAEALGCPAYFSEQDGKAQILQELVAGQHQVVAATSALGMGIDIADIRVVAHIGKPWSMLDYAQESGRAGRDGKRSQAVILLSGQVQASSTGYAVSAANPAGEGEEDAQERQLVQRYMEGGQCRRVVLDQYLDGQERVACSEQEEACDICQAVQGVPQEEGREQEAEAVQEAHIEHGPADPNSQLSMQERELFWTQQHQQRQPRQRQQQQLRQLGQDMEDLVRQLHRWQSRCAICVAAGSPTSHHSLASCKMAESMEAQQTAQAIAKKIKYARFSGCFYCGLPQSVCSRWEAKEQGGRWQRSGEDCQFSGVLIEGLTGILLGFHSQIGDRHRVRLAEQGFSAAGMDQWVEYLGRKTEQGEVESNKLVWEFLWAAQQVQ